MTEPDNALLECKTCGKSPFTKRGMSRHVTTAHPLSKGWTCPRCGETFATVDEIVNHACKPKKVDRRRRHGTNSNCISTKFLHALQAFLKDHPGSTIDDILHEFNSHYAESTIRIYTSSLAGKKCIVSKPGNSRKRHYYKE